ncbi:MAG: hypothetical protein ACXWZL_10265 [Mycobacterium sp.]
MPTLASTICFVVHHAGGSAQHDGRPARDHPGQKKHTVDPEVVGDFRGAPVRLGFRLTLEAITSPR